MARLVVGFVACSLIATVLAGSTWGGSPTELLVGYSVEDSEAAHAAVLAAGGVVVRESPELGVALVRTGAPAMLASALARSPAVSFVESNDGVQAAGAQWNGAQWNGAQWNGAQWNGAQWNGAQWNGAQWNGAQWNGAQWNGAQWNGAQWNGAQWNGAQWNGAQWNAAQWTRDIYFDQGHKRGGNPVFEADPGMVWQWGTWAIRAPAAWAVTTGSLDVTICVLDTGVAWDHPDIAPNAWTGAAGERGFNVFDLSTEPWDDAGHGTHVAGVAAGAIGNQHGIAGVANARILPVKVLDAEGRGTEDGVAMGLTWCATQGADVALMALSTDTPSLTLERAIAFAASRDVLMVASAGNDACGACVSYPASDPRVLAVAAVDGKDRLAPFSSAGPEVELAAPGVDVLGPLPGGLFAFGSGTSQAAAYVAGAAALVRAQHPDLDATQVRAALAAAALPLGAAGTGHGLVQVDTVVR